MILDDVWNVTFVLTFTPLRHIWAEHAGQLLVEATAHYGLWSRRGCPRLVWPVLRSTPISITLTRMRTDVPRSPEPLQALPLR